MTLSILLPLLIAIIGAFVYVASKTNAKVAEIGRLAFACGLLVTLFEVATHVVKF